jgi:gamma-glutamylcyclotransferase (GGCT)/AIG2-like uncharacterized protein YtfP
MSTPSSVFVYGTLKRGELRGSAWPRRPVRVASAVVEGTLYDLGRYPTLVAGKDCVRGELWTFARDDLPPTLEALDAIEGYANSPCDLYVRRIVTCEDDDGSDIPAWTYLFARTEWLDAARRILPDAWGFCAWSPEKR